MASKIKKLFTQVHKVPQVPEVIRILINQFNDPNVEMRDIARNVEKEPVISLKVLRLVNSAAYGLPKKLGSIEEAVVMLGMTKLKTLVIASGIVSAMPEIEDFDIKQFWLDSFSTASYAKWLANETGNDADIAFTAGLISDLGRVLIRLGLAKEAKEIERRVSEGHSRAFVEKMRLSFTSQEVSAELCRLWKFSDALIIPVEQSAEPLQSDPVSKIACIVYIARFISSSKSSGMLPDDMLQAMPADATEQLGLAGDFFKQKLEDLLALESGLDGLLD
ncbi:MAG: HDOD domain-containing protein [Methylococcaceae bacterium]|nr:HDOD domain-containing protein [Methylococcaceae bacterium]